MEGLAGGPPTDPALRETLPRVHFEQALARNGDRATLGLPVVNPVVAGMANDPVGSGIDLIGGEDEKMHKIADALEMILQFETLLP